MRKVIYLLGLVVTFCTSCQFSENIYINEDGSGKMEFSFDASALMEMAGDEMSEDGEERMDSIMHFRDFLVEKKDSISKLSKQEQEELKALEPFSLHMLMDPKTKEMNFELFTEFKSVNELQDMFAAMSKIQSLDSKKDKKDDNPFGKSFGGNNTDVSYAFENNVFTRTSKIINKELHEQSLDSLDESAGMIFASSKYKLNYHFPRKIKSVSNEDVLFSEDRKSFVLELDFMEYVRNPQSGNIEVVLEDK